MATPQQIRNLRLQNDFRQMTNIKGAIVSWEAAKGTPPYVEQYKLTVNVPTIIDSSSRTRTQHLINVTIPSNYPQSPPMIVMESSPQPFHPNWYRDGRWCHGRWNISEGLGDYVIRMIRTLNFDLEVSNPDDAANSNAVGSFKTWKSQRKLPLNQNILLPDPSKSKFNINNQKKKFNINNGNG